MKAHRGNRLDFAGLARSAVAPIPTQGHRTTARWQGEGRHAASQPLPRECSGPDHPGCGLRDSARQRIDLRCGGACGRTAWPGATDRLRPQAGSRQFEYPLASCPGYGWANRLSTLLHLLSRASSAAARRGSQGAIWPRRSGVSHRSGNTLIRTLRGPLRQEVAVAVYLNYLLSTSP